MVKTCGINPNVVPLQLPFATETEVSMVTLGQSIVNSADPDGAQLASVQVVGVSV